MMRGLVHIFLALARMLIPNVITFLDFEAFFHLTLYRTQPTLSGKQKRQLQEKLEYVQEVVKTKKVLRYVCVCATDSGKVLAIKGQYHWVVLNCAILSH